MTYLDFLRLSGKNTTLVKGQDAFILAKHSQFYIHLDKPGETAGSDIPDAPELGNVLADVPVKEFLKMAPFCSEYDYKAILCVYIYAGGTMAVTDGFRMVYETNTTVYQDTKPIAMVNPDPTFLRVLTKHKNATLHVCQEYVFMETDDVLAVHEFVEGTPVSMAKVMPAETKGERYSLPSVKTLQVWYETEKLVHKKVPPVINVAYPLDTQPDPDTGGTGWVNAKYLIDGMKLGVQEITLIDGKRVLGTTEDGKYNYLFMQVRE